MGPGWPRWSSRSGSRSRCSCSWPPGARAGAWNFHLYKTFADPFTTPGLVSDPSMHDGFVFEVHDLVERRRALFRTPEESYGLLACIGAPSRYVVEHVFSKEGAIAASTSIPGPSRSRGAGTRATRS